MTERLHTLTGLRFYAAMLVFVSHLYTFNFFMGNQEFAWQEYVTHLGFLGVSFFFALSGFILFLNYIGPDFKPIDWKKFYVSRIARIYPAFLVTLILAIPLQLLSHQFDWFISSFLLNLSLTQSYSFLAWKSFNMPAWSISNEMTFYLVFPLLALVFRKHLMQNLLWGLGLFSLYLFLMNVAFGHTYYAEDRFPLNRILEFFLGMMAGWVYVKIRNLSSVVSFFKKSWIPILLGTIIVLLFTAMVMEPMVLDTTHETRHFNFLYYSVFILPFILTFALAEYHQKPIIGFASPLVILGGELSYGIYLLHHMIFRYEKRLLTLFIDRDWVSNMSPMLGLFVLPVLLISTCGLAYLMYRYIEVPWRQKIVAKFSDAPGQIPQNISLGQTADCR